MHYNELIHSINSPNGSIDHFNGWNTLTIESNPNDIYIHGQADFTARQEVNIKSEFTTTLNSETHIFTSEVFNDCNEFSNFNHARLSKSIITKPNNGTELELNFKISNLGKLFIYPNPTNNLITVKLNVNNEIDNNILYTISDLNGKIIYQNKLNNIENIIDVSTFSKGIYTLTVICNSFVLTKKIIVQ